MKLSNDSYAAVGIPYLTKKSFEKVLDPSSWAAACEGPKTLIFFDKRKSAKPITSGCSGPIITRLIFSSLQKAAIDSKSLCSISILVSLSSSSVPAFPGQTKTSVTFSS